jgi:hypothetical protein
MTHVAPDRPVHPSRPIRAHAGTHVSLYPHGVEHDYVTAIELDPNLNATLGRADFKDAARAKGVVHDLDAHMEPRGHWKRHIQILSGLGTAVERPVSLGTSLDIRPLETRAGSNTFSIRRPGSIAWIRRGQEGDFAAEATAAHAPSAEDEGCLARLEPQDDLHLRLSELDRTLSALARPIATTRRLLRSCPEARKLFAEGRAPRTRVTAGLARTAGSLSYAGPSWPTRTAPRSLRAVLAQGRVSGAGRFLAGSRARSAEPVEAVWGLTPSRIGRPADRHKTARQGKRGHLARGLLP